MTTFLEMHHAPRGFVLPNAWDAGSARILEQVGFPAIATTSAGIAWSCGVPDGGALDLDTMLEHVGRIVAAVGVPVTADLESGYDDVDDVDRPSRGRGSAPSAATSRTRWAGSCSGSTRPPTGSRPRAPRRPPGTFVLNARTDTWFGGATGDVFAETVERAVRYVEAGADCVFVPGVVEEDDDPPPRRGDPGPAQRRGRAVASVTDAPTLFSLGVKRVSLGGSLARAALQLPGARRPGAARLRHPRLPRRRHRLRRPAAPVRRVIAVVGGHGKTGRAVCSACRSGRVETAAARAGPTGADLAGALAGLRGGVPHRAEPAPGRAGVRRGGAGGARGRRGVARVVYHSVASPYAPEMPHHLGKAVSEDLVRRSGLAWTILQPGAYLQNLDLSGADRGALRRRRGLRLRRPARRCRRCAALVLTEDGHVGATYELASRAATVAELAAEAGVTATRTDERPDGWLGAMFAYYDRYGLPVGTRTLDALLGRAVIDPR